MRDNTNAESVHEYHQGNRPKVVAAILCFNTEHFIGDVASRTKKYVDQVFVIDDGSSDNTGKIAH